MLHNMPDFIFYPLATLWSLFYGTLAGAWFRLVAVFENWVAINRLELILWKKYPQRSYRKYISHLWSSQIMGRPMELGEYARARIEQTNPVEPFPVLRLIINSVFMILITPYMIALGLIDGPVYVYRRMLEMRHRHKVMSR